ALVSRSKGPSLTAPPAMTPERATVLTAAAVSSGARWAKSERALLRAEGRRAEGGWPGTLSQARNYVQSAVPKTGGSLSHDELAWMARAIYESARRDWLAFSEPEER
ncbi:MAG TPA: hypothetical protein VM686_21185, partial [Polyangiaceae bacterium]|nr:hypothetical protein [Polyangiaceae bacterium]